MASDPVHSIVDSFIQSQKGGRENGEAFPGCEERTVASGGQPSTQKIIEHLQQKPPGEVIDVLEKAEEALQRIESLIDMVEVETEADRLHARLAVSQPEDDAQAHLRFLMARRRSYRKEKMAAENVLNRSSRRERQVAPDSADTDLPLSTRKYLKVAHEWLKEGNRPEGGKPTELWKHIHRQTGKSKDTIRSTFKNRGWYNPNAGMDPETDMTPTKFTVQAVRDAYEKHLR